MEIKKIQIKQELDETIFHPETSDDQVLVGDRTLKEELYVINKDIDNVSVKIEQAVESLNYTNDMPMLTSLGGYPAGTTFDNVSIANFLTGLLYPYVAPKISLSSTPGSGVRDYDNPLTTLTLRANVQKQSYDLQTVDFYRGTELLQHYETFGDKTSFECLVEESIRKTTTFTAKVSDGRQTVTSNNITYTFVYPFYVGQTTDETIESLQLVASDKRVQTKGNVTKTYSTSQERFYIAYPATYGNLSSVLDTNQFEIILDFEKGTKTVSMNDGTQVTYNVYLFKNLVSVSNFTVTYKF